MKGIITIGLILSVLIATTAAGDTVILKNGDKITGEGCSVSGDTVKLKTDYSKNIELKLSGVEKIIYDEPVRIIYTDGEEAQLDNFITSDLDLSTIESINPPLPAVWTVDISAGYSLNSGNTDNQSANAEVTIVRTVEELLRLTGYGEYFWGKTDSQATGKERVLTDQGLASLQADLFLIKHGYIYGRSVISFDKLKDLDRRLDNGIGIGYQVLKTKDAFIDLETGGAYIDSKYDDGTEDYGIFLRLAENGQWKISRSLTFTESVEYLPKAKDFDDYLVNASAAIRVDLGSNLYFKISVIDKYDNIPATGKKRNDLAVIASVGMAI